MADSKINIRKRSLRGVAKRRLRPAKQGRGGQGRVKRSRLAAASQPVPELVPPARDLLESLPVSAMVLDRDRRVVGVNARLLADMALPGDFEVPGETLAELAQRAALLGEPALIALGDTLAQAWSAQLGTEMPICEIVTRGDVHLEICLSSTTGGGFVVTLARRAGPVTAQRLRMLDEIVAHQRGAVFRRVVHADGRVSLPFVSADAKTTFGVAAEIMMREGRDIFSFVLPVERAEVEKKVREYTENPGPIDFQFNIVTPAKERKFIRCTGRSYHGADGETVWDGRITDIQRRQRAEEESRRLRALLDSVVENIPHVVSVRSASDMTYVLFNKAGEDTFGIKREDILGKTSNEVFPEIVAARRRARDRQIIKTGKPAEFPEVTFESPKTGQRIVKTRKVPLFGDDGKVEYVLSITEDVTEWRNAQEALEDSEKRFRDIAEAASDWFWETDAEMRFVDITEGSIVDQAYDISEMKGKTRRDTALPEDIAEEPEKWAKYDDDVKNRRPIRNFVYRVRRKSEGPGYVRVSGNPVFGDDGEFLGYRGAATNITAEVEAKARAARARSQLLEAVECFSDGFALFDADDRMVMCNQQYRKTWPMLERKAKPGVTYAELVRAIADSGDLPFGYPTVESFVSERVAAHRNAPSTREQRFRDGRWVKITHSRTSDGGIVITCIDITAHKEREESLRRTSREALGAKETAEIASRAKSEFLANMSHELRTPLNAVIGFSEIIKGGLMGDAPNENYRNYASDIHHSGKHLLELINDILDMSKIEAGKLELSEEEVNVRNAIESCIVLVRERADKSDIALDISVPGDMPGIRADLRKLKQILINLLSNAVKFTEPGGRVTVESRIDSDGALLLLVIDTGIGMKPDEIAKALEPFGQIDAGLDRTYEGTGLGLTLTKALVELHGGKLAISSRSGDGATGTTVTITFPADRVIQD
ncbi:MAG: PAS domain-containing protein [Gammaproteobacteria bacterium]|nr:PAS domain-containing protein [Gammaproteobacteria bacterium]